MSNNKILMFVIALIALMTSPAIFASEGKCLSSCTQEHVQYFRIVNYTETEMTLYYNQVKGGELCDCNLPTTLGKGASARLGIESNNVCFGVGTTDAHAYIDVNSVDFSGACQYDIKLDLTGLCGQSVEPTQTNSILGLKCSGSGSTLTITR